MKFYLKETLKEKGISQRKFAKIIGVSQAAVNEWCNAAVSPAGERDGNDVTGAVSCQWAPLHQDA